LDLVSPASEGLHSCWVLGSWIQSWAQSLEFTKVTNSIEAS
jgi:hypothetical protein